MKYDRVPLWDNLRFLLIVFVVVGHFAILYNPSTLFDSTDVFLYSFHMPLFLFVAGLFHKNTRVPGKMLGYFTIYLLLKTFIFFVKTAFQRSPSFYLFLEDGTPWFMYTLAVYIGLTYLLRDVDRRLVLAAAILMACISGYDSHIGNKLVLSRSIVFYPFYLAGTMTPRAKLEALAAKKSLKLPAALLLLAWAGCCFLFLSDSQILYSLFQGNTAFDETVYPYGILLRILCMVIASVMGLAVIMVTPLRPLPVITTAGQRSLQIYFWHRPILYVLTYIGLPEALCPTPVGKILWLLIAVALCFFLALRPFTYPTKWIVDWTRTPPHTDKTL